MNALVAVPFLVSILRPALERNLERHERLCLALGIRGFARWSLIDWPSLRGALGQAAALGVAFSLGDLVAVGLYGDPSIRTLNLLLYDQVSAYRMQNAAATALILMIVVVTAFRLIERGIGGRHAP
jgi:thiamine transport system permease protein